ncbi:hypothetical protein [Microcoleus anatoxicus]|uniref:Transposase n=1 Tax=Microcoleus anatoxicus PTRS2 TaxID=2705321 RepID=A0ABU8YV66_9CYAN
MVLYYFAGCDRTSKLSYRFWAIACRGEQHFIYQFSGFCDVYRSVR